jgi:hypothetical protein
LQIFLFFALAMKRNAFKRCGIAFLLLLIFFQQIGAGLYIHNLEHKSKTQSHSQHNEAAKEINFSCSCVDNFLTPFIDADELVVDRPITFHAAVTIFFAERVYFTSIIYPSLRGPPVFIG